MRTPLGSFLWFTLVSCAVAYVASVFGASLSFAQARGDFEPVIVRDSLGEGSHQLSGMIEVAATCDELRSNVEKESPTQYRIAFATWQDPAVTCAPERTPREFEEIIFAPAVGVDFVATLDDNPLPISVVPVIVQH